MSRPHKTRTANSRDDWETPPALFEFIEKVCIPDWKFTLDPAASETNHKCLTYFTELQDGLKQSWEGHIVFVNPPYKNKSSWIKKAWEECRDHKVPVVMLIPSIPELKAWHEYIFPHAHEIYFTCGRISFMLDGKAISGNTYGSAVIYFKPNSFLTPQPPHFLTIFKIDGKYRIGRITD